MVLCGLAVADPDAARALALSVTPERSTDGVYQLLWSAPGPVVLEEARDPDFGDARVVYRGSDRSSVLTGRSDGTYYYRLRGLDEDPQAFAAASVSVEHHGLTRAFAFFGVGLVVFACTVVLVLRAPEDRGPGRVG